MQFSTAVPVVAHDVPGRTHRVARPPRLVAGAVGVAGQHSRAFLHWWRRCPAPLSAGKESRCWSACATRCPRRRSAPASRMGASTVAEVGEACGAGTGRGGCRSGIRALLFTPPHGGGLQTRHRRRGPPPTDQPVVEPVPRLPCRRIAPAIRLRAGPYARRPGAGRSVCLTDAVGRERLVAVRARSAR
jgi:hypothetical protein